MSYVYLIQKKSDLNQNIFKCGMLKTKKNINKENKIHLLIEDKYKCINFSELISLLEITFKKHTKKNYFQGVEQDLVYFISNYYRSNFYNKFNNQINEKKKEIVDKICLSDFLKDTEKYEQLIKFSNKKIEIRNILFDSSLTYGKKRDEINKIIFNTNINSFGNENLDYITNDMIISLIKNDNLINILDNFLNLVHFNNEYPENKNITYDKFSINIIENNLLMNKINNKEMYDKIFDNTIFKLYVLIYKALLLNMDNDELYHKGLLMLKKINLIKQN
jgi:hypothetical protein